MRISVSALATWWYGQCPACGGSGIGYYRVDDNTVQGVCNDCGATWLQQG